MCRFFLDKFSTITIIMTDSREREAIRELQKQVADLTERLNRLDPDRAPLKLSVECTYKNQGQFVDKQPSIYIVSSNKDNIQHCVKQFHWTCTLMCNTCNKDQRLNKNCEHTVAVYNYINPVFAN